VLPLLRTSDGGEVGLPAVTIKPAEVKLVDIGASAPQLAGKYGSAVLRYRSVASRGLYASVMIQDPGYAIAFHIDGGEQPQNFEGTTREGIWWLPNETAADHLVLTNQGRSVIQFELSLYDRAGREFKQHLTIGPSQTTRYSVRQVVRAAHLSGSYGGIKIRAGIHAGSLDSVHFIFDEQAGFSALLKMFDYDSRATIAQRDHAGTGTWTLRAPMLALSQPDPVLAFPNNTVLQPEMFIRNTTGKEVIVRLRFNWRSQSATGKGLGPTIKLGPFETRLIDISMLQDDKILPKEANWTSVVLTTKGLPDEVMAVAASYDKTLRYGTQTPFSDQLSFKWEGSRWEYDTEHDSIITAGNGGIRPSLAAFTIAYNEGKERYELEQMLQPDEQMWIDVGQLIREQVPDKNGKVLPVDLSSGSYELRDLTSVNGRLFEGKVIYDKTYGHVAYGCGGPCCYNMPYLTYNPLGVPFLGTSGNGVDTSDNCGGNPIPVSSSFYYNWNTANHAIATVDYRGTHTGRASGSTSSNTSGQIDQVYGRYSCTLQTRNPVGTTDVCDFTIYPGSLTSKDCTTGTEQSQGFTTQLYPSTCSQVYKGTGSCSATASGNIELTVGTPTCNISSLAPPSATLKYFSGPKRSDGTAGVINMDFTVNFIGSSVSHSDPATVACP